VGMAQAVGVDALVDARFRGEDFVDFLRPMLTLAYKTEHAVDVKSDLVLAAGAGGA